jgi:hypothetical protein
LPDFARQQKLAPAPAKIDLQRADWERAMVDGQRNAAWMDFEPDTGLRERAEELALQKYSQADYNRKR